MSFGGRSCLIGFSVYLVRSFLFKVLPFGLPLSLSAFCFGGGGRWMPFAPPGK